MTEPSSPATGERLAKVMARAGLCSRRDAETWIRAGRVSVNGEKIVTPAFNVTARDEVLVDGAPLGARAGTRVWLYHKPKGLVVTEKDPEGRPTVFETLAQQGLPRVVSVGRLDINTEGLLLLTNDGGLKRVLELPATGWLRKYRVRAHGTITQAQLDGLAAGAEIEGVKYGPVTATLEREQGSNVWLELALREGKNREVKNVLAALGLAVNRLIRISFGPFQLGDLPVGAVAPVKARVLKEQLGDRLAARAGADFVSEMPEPARGEARRPGRRPERTEGRGTRSATIDRARFRFTDRAEMGPEQAADRRQERARTRPSPGGASRPRRPEGGQAGQPRERHIHFDDGRAPVVFEDKGKPDRDGAPRRGGKPAGAERAFRGPPRGTETPRPRPRFGDRPRPARAGGGARMAGDAGGADRPTRARGKPAAGKPFRGRPGADGGKPAAGRPRAPRAASGGPARPAADRPRRPRPAGGSPRPGGPPRPRGGGAPRPTRPRGK